LLFFTSGLGGGGETGAEDAFFLGGALGTGARAEDGGVKEGRVEFLRSRGIGGGAGESSISSSSDAAFRFRCLGVTTRSEREEEEEEEEER
jgi:hypothetical protein